MAHSEGTFKSNDGLSLYRQKWQPDGRSKAAVVIVHGFAEYSGRYEHVAKYLNDKGYTVYSFDLRGHGKSEGDRVFVNSFDEYIVDLKTFLSYVKGSEENGPIFLLGHSLGGAIATLFVITQEAALRGLILSAPLLKTPEDISPIFLGLNSLISRILPKLLVLEKVDSKLLSRNSKVVENYDNDPLIYHERISAREASEINRAISLIQAGLESINLPLLILHGTKDCVADSSGSKDLYAKAASSDKVLKLYDGFYHEILNEIDNIRVLEDIASWLAAHE